jgi:hypothetical protein
MAIELTSTQLAQIESYLTKRNMIHIDIRLEVLDHMISDIELAMEEDEMSFELAFEKTKKEWNKHFKSTSSLVFGVQYDGPKLMIEKAKKLFRMHYFVLMILYFILFLSIDILQIGIWEKITVYLNYILNTVMVITTICLAYMFYTTGKTKQQTTFSFILKTQRFSLVLLFIPLLNGGFFKNGIVNGISVGILASLLYLTYVSFNFYKKHKEAIVKYAIE